MTVVTINEKYRVDIDNYNHTLQYLTKGGVMPSGKDKGKPTPPKWVDEGYYSNLQGWLKRIMYLEATLVPDCDLNGYIRCLNDLEANFNKEYAV